MKKINVKSPTRVDLVGGTCDLWPIYNFIQPVYTINLAIDIFTYAEIIERADKKIILKSEDINLHQEFSNLTEFLDCEDEKLTLLKPHIHYWMPEKGFELTTKSESPIGGGLGGSSSLSISIITAFSEFCEKKLMEEEKVRLASNIEAQILKTPTGTQDYYPPIYGGALALEYNPLEVVVHKLNFPKEIFDEKFVLVYTGKPHHSGMNNWQVLKNVIDGDKNSIHFLNQLAQESVNTFQELQNNNWECLSNTFDKEYNIRTLLSEVFTIPEIDHLREISQDNQLGDIKICGAGGGGCVILWANDRAAKEQLCKKVENLGFKVLPSLPTKIGSQTVVEEL